jgi:ATP-dependent helicase Lhr and Lhr-like helicase
MYMEQKLKIAEDWFEKKGWEAFQFQSNVWKAFLKEENGLLNAPTGSGKTYAIWFGILLHFIDQNPDWQLNKKRGLKAIWVTPLRALAKDIQLALQTACFEIGLPWEVALRTGDTTAAERRKQSNQMPECIVTTPESLHILLSQKNNEKVFGQLQYIVVDEWHELLGTKRGVQMELVSSRVRQITKSKPLLVWGVSATIGNLDQALEILTYGSPKANIIIKATHTKKINIKSILPDEVEKFPWAGHLGIHLIDKVLPLINQSKTTLIFTNTRSQTEMWYQAILNEAPELAGLIAMHHGSLDNSVRAWVEDALHNEKLKAVVCTSSLDLGVDFRPVENVIQVGGPKGIARFLQRAGRSGHHPGAESNIYFLPTHSLELLEGAALREAYNQNIMETRNPLEKSFDVLVQYLVTLATGDGFYPDAIFKEISHTYAFRNITMREWQWVLQFITTGGESLGEYEDYMKVEIEEGKYVVNSRKVAMRHRLSIGTIVSDPVLKIKYMTGGFIGTVEESFISRMNTGDTFLFAGRFLEYIKIKEMTVLVKKSNKKKGLIPRWMGGRLPMSSQLSQMLRTKLEEAVTSKKLKDPELIKIFPILDLQQKWSIVPLKDKLLIEYLESKEGFHIFIYPFEGRYVHEVLASLVAYRVSRLTPITFSIAMNDYGFELLSDVEIPIEEALEEDLFSVNNLWEDITSSINSTEMAKRKFRDIASIAGLIFQGYPGKNISNKYLQASAQLLYNVLDQYDKNNLLTKQAKEEVINLQLEKSRLMEAMDRINMQEIILKRPPKPTPFAFPIMVDRLRENISSEKLEDRILRIQTQLEKYAAGK